MENCPETVSSRTTFVLSGVVTPTGSSACSPASPGFPSWGPGAGDGENATVQGTTKAGNPRRKQGQGQQGQSRALPDRFPGRSPLERFVTVDGQLLRWRQRGGHPVVTITGSSPNCSGGVQYLTGNSPASELRTIVHHVLLDSLLTAQRHSQRISASQSEISSPSPGDSSSAWLSLSGPINV